MPGERLGVGGILDLTSGSSVARIDVQLTPGTAQAAQSLPGFVTQQVSWQQTASGFVASGTVTSPYYQDATKVQVSALAYDPSGAIEGGGSTVVDVVPARGQKAVQVPLVASAPPSRVELYPALTSGSTFRRLHDWPRPAFADALVAGALANLRSLTIPEVAVGWLGKPQGIFKLHESDRFCGSFLNIDDAAEVLGVEPAALAALPVVSVHGTRCVDENDLQRAWSSGRIPSPHPPKIGQAMRSLDEIILWRLATLTLDALIVEPQVPFGRKRVDLRITSGGETRLIEFVGPSHFIPQYERPIRSPLERKAEIEDHFGAECVLWPYWVQRCS